MHRTRLALLPFALIAPMFAACSDSSSSAVPPTDALPVRSAAAHQIDLPDGDYEANLHVLNAAAQNGQDPDRADGALGVARGMARWWRWCRPKGSRAG